MGLLGKFFRGSSDRDENIGSRSKRGRAPSIRTPVDTEKPAAPAGPALPEINIDDIEKARQAPAARPEAVAAPAAPSKAPEKPPIQVDLPAAKPAAPAKPAGAARPEPKAAPAAAPRPGKPAAAAPAAPAPAPAAEGPSRRTTRLQSRQKPIGELLIQAGSVSTEQLSRALKIQDKGGKGLVGQILTSMGACQQGAILVALNRQFRISTVELDRIEIPLAAASLVPAEKCREHRLIPFEKMGTTLCVSMANCLNRKAINEVEELTKLKVKPFNSTWIEIRRAIEAISKKAAAPAAAAAEPAPAEVAEPASPEAAAAPAAEEEAVAAASGAEPAPSEAPPFAAPARARIEGLDELGSTEAEVVQETSRGLASKHLDEIKRRRAKRQELMGTGQGVVGRLVAPGLEAYRPEGAAGEAAPAAAPAGAPELVPLRMVDEHLLAGTDLPVAKQLAANLEAFRAPAAAVAPTAPPPVRAPAAAPAPAPEPEPEPEPEPAPAPAKRAAPELPPVPSISFKPEEVKEVVPAAISDEEWAAMQADLELDPVVLWQATYASAGPVPAAQSWL